MAAHFAGNEAPRTPQTQTKEALWLCRLRAEDTAAGFLAGRKGTHGLSAAVGWTADSPSVESFNGTQVPRASVQQQGEEGGKARASEERRDDTSFFDAAVYTADIRVNPCGGRSCNSCGPPTGEIETFARNAQELKVIRYRTLLEEYEPSSICRATYEDAAAALQAFANGCATEGVPLLPWYICLWAAHRFAEKRGYFPGTDVVFMAGISHASCGKSENATVHCGTGSTATTGAVASDSRSKGNVTLAYHEIRRPETVFTAADLACPPTLEGESEIDKKEDGKDDADFALSRNALDRSRRDECALQAEVSRLLSELKCDGLEVGNRIIRQFVAFGGAELHCCAALVGGAAAQEAVKLICKQYEPINNTFIWCGVERMAQVLEL